MAYTSNPTDEHPVTSNLNQEHGESSYLKACVRFQCKIDAGIIVTIRNELEAYKPSIKLTDNDLLAVCEALCDLNHVSKLDLSHCSVSCNGAYLLCELLRQNKSIIELDLSQNNISDLGAQALSEILQIEGSQLKKLVVHYNAIGKKGALHLAQGLKLNSCLEQLDISNNCLGSYGAKIIRVALMERAMAKKQMLMIGPAPTRPESPEFDLNLNDTEQQESVESVESVGSTKSSVSSSGGRMERVGNRVRNLSITPFDNDDQKTQRRGVSPTRSRSDLRSPYIPNSQLLDQWISGHQLEYMQEQLGLFINFNGNFMKEEVFNSVTHAVGLILAGIASAVLMHDAGHYSILCQVACGIFSFTLMFMYLASSLYHSLVHCTCARHVFHVLDFSSIFLLIAGTYTPILIIGLSHSPFHSLILFILMWSVAIIGVGYSSYADPHDDKWKKLTMLYLAMSYSGLLCAKPIVESFETMAWLLIVGGGAFYTAGVWFIANDAVVPIYHTIWHICVIFGSACHFLCILLYIVPMDVMDRPSIDLTFAHVIDNLFFAIPISRLFFGEGDGHNEL